MKLEPICSYFAKFGRKPFTVYKIKTYLATLLPECRHTMFMALFSAV